MGNVSTVFISGTGRSGTNVTKAIFGKHSQCATLPFEYRISIDPGGIVDFLNHYSHTWSPFMADKRLRDLEEYLLRLGKRDTAKYAASSWLRTIDPRSENITPYAYAGWELEKCFPGYNKFVSLLMDQLVDYKYTASWPGSVSLSKSNQMYFGSPKKKEELIPILGPFLNNCFKSYLDLTEKQFFVEDNTWSILYANDLLSLVPNAKILHIIRDPRDVVSSLIKQRWAPTSLDQVLKWYRSIIETWKLEKNRLNDNQFLEVRLEDIIANPSDSIETMCRFVGLDYEKSMSQLDLSKSNSGRYKTELSEEEIIRVEEELNLIISEYGY